MVCNNIFHTLIQSSSIFDWPVSDAGTTPPHVCLSSQVRLNTAMKNIACEYHGVSQTLFKIEILVWYFTGILMFAINTLEYRNQQSYLQEIILVMMDSKELTSSSSSSSSCVFLLPLYRRCTLYLIWLSSIRRGAWGHVARLNCTVKNNDINIGQHEIAQLLLCSNITATHKIYRSWFAFLKNCPNIYLFAWKGYSHLRQFEMNKNGFAVAHETPAELCSLAPITVSTWHNIFIELDFDANFS